MGFALRPITCVSRGATLRGTAYVPGDRDAPHPTVVLHHGFGGNRIEASRLFVQIARVLASEGFAVVAFDRAGHGESDGEFGDTTVSGDIGDSIEMLDHVSTLGFVDPDDLHLLGLSMGAVVAAVVAAEAPIEVRSLTLWSVAAIFVDEIRGGFLQGESTDSVAADGYFDFHGLRIRPGFFEDAVGFDVYGRAEGFTGPVRVFHGGRDFIPSSYAEAYSEIYGEAMDFTLVAEADHTWESVPVRDGLIAESVAFIRLHSRN